MAAATAVTGRTTGVCIGGEAMFAADGQASLCYAQLPNGDSGMVASVGAGAGTSIALSGFLGPMMSNANSWSELGGWSPSVSGGAGELLASGAGSYSWSTGQCGGVVWQGAAGWAPSVRLPTGLQGVPGVSLATGGSYSWTK